MLNAQYRVFIYFQYWITVFILVLLFRLYPKITWRNCFYMFSLKIILQFFFQLKRDLIDSAMTFYFVSFGTWFMAIVILPREQSASSQRLTLFSNKILLHSCNLTVCIVSFIFIIRCMGNFILYFLTFILTFLGICCCWLGIWVDRGSCG